VLVCKAETAASIAEESKSMVITAWIAAGLIVLLSIQPVLNMLSTNQAMNSSYDPLDLVNTYGAFGSVGQQRMNVIFEGTSDDTTGNKARWQPYIYKGLPVLLDKQPPQIAPYQLRLDWQMWFASMSTADQYPWTYNLVWKLLHNDPDAVGLFAENPFPHKPPRYIRAMLYDYKFAKPGSPNGLYWTRDAGSEWLPVLSNSDPRLINFLASQGWIR